MTMEEKYALIWFEGDEYYTLVDRHNKTVLIAAAEAKESTAGILRTEDDVENALDDLRYAIPANLLQELFGWDV